MKELLEMDAGDGLTTVWTHLDHPPAHLKMVKMITFVLHILYHNKKWKKWKKIKDKQNANILNKDRINISGPSFCLRLQYGSIEHCYGSSLSLKRQYSVHYRLFLNCDFCKDCLEISLILLSEETWGSPLNLVTQESVSLSSPTSPWAPVSFHCFVLTFLALLHFYLGSNLFLLCLDKEKGPRSWCVWVIKVMFLSVNLPDAPWAHHWP